LEQEIKRIKKEGLYSTKRMELKVLSGADIVIPMVQPVESDKVAQKTVLGRLNTIIRRVG